MAVLKISPRFLPCESRLGHSNRSKSQDSQFSNLRRSGLVSLRGAILHGENRGENASVVKVMTTLVVLDNRTRNRPTRNRPTTFVQILTQPHDRVTRKYFRLFPAKTGRPVNLGAPSTVVECHHIDTPVGFSLRPSGWGPPRGGSRDWLTCGSRVGSIDSFGLARCGSKWHTGFDK